jgi:16S rRNA (uracil1498-N3)-methyltransferase
MAWHYIIGPTRNAVTMQIPRFFLTQNALDFESSDIVAIADMAVVNQVRNVLRMQIGDRIVLLDGEGSLYECTITGMPAKAIECRIEQKSQAPGEPPVDVTIGLALIKGERFEWALQKLCEIGVRKIVPLITARTVVKVDTVRDAKGANAKVTRWQAILKEAAEQCERATIPQITIPQKLNEFMDASTRGGTSPSMFICAERLPVASLKDILLDYARGQKDQHATAQGAITLLVGPEGGFTEDEIAFAQKAGAMPVSLGPRILRAETAAIYAVAQVIWCLEN